MLVRRTSTRVIIPQGEFEHRMRAALIVERQLPRTDTDTFTVKSDTYDHLSSDHDKCRDSERVSPALHDAAFGAEGKVKDCAF